MTPYSFKSYLAAGLIAINSVMPAWGNGEKHSREHGTQGTLEQLIQESRARKEQMRKDIAAHTYSHGPSQGYPGKSPASRLGAAGPTKASQERTPASTGAQPLAFDTQLSFTPSTEENTETYTLGPLKYLQAFDSNTGANTARFFYGQITNNLSIYGSQYPGGEWHFGPSVTIPTSKKTSVSVDLAYKDANVFFTCGDGTVIGPISLRDPTFRRLELSHLAWYYGVGNAIKAVAGHDAQEAAEKGYSLYRFASHPSPLGFAVSAFNELRTEEHGRGSFGRDLRKAFNILTFGIFK